MEATKEEDSPTFEHFTEEIADFSDTNEHKLRGHFYSVFIPQDLRQKGTLASKHIFKDKVEAMKVVKKTKKARFKYFEYFHEALKFANAGSLELQPPHQVNGSSVTVSPQMVGEKLSLFKGPKSQDLVKLRKSIETGDVEYFTQAVWENPRYLVSSGDTPSILQEGFRYNALHVAAKARNALLTELILNTISNPKFVKLLYGDDQNESIENRMEVLMDLYLNTPDKGLNETPLHFASKFGAAEVVEVLVSFPECDKTLKNKYGQTADMIICDRCDSKDGIAALKRKITVHLENCYYVPVLRAEDNSVAPLVGEPFSPGKAPVINRDPLSPRLEIHAYAGPMNKEGAEHFRKVWKTPPRTSTPIKNRRDDSFESVVALRYTDLTKGLERLGQKLATRYDVNWKEYWSFLDCFIDVTSEEGLSLLENYLIKRIATLDRSYSACKDTPDESSEKSSGTISDLCAQLQNCNLHDDDETDNNINAFLCVEKACYVFATRIAVEIYNRVFENFQDQVISLEVQMRQVEMLILSYLEDSRFNEVNFSQLHPRLGFLTCEKICYLVEKIDLPDYIRALNDFVVDCAEAFERHSSDDESKDVRSTSLKRQLLCLMRHIVKNFQKEYEFPPVELDEESACRRAWKISNECYCLFNFKRQRRILRHSFKTEAKSRKLLFCDEKYDDLTEDSSSDEDFFTPPSSPGVICDGEEEEFSDAQLMMEIFLEEENPTRTDCALFKALKYSESGIITPGKYPSIYRWYHNVNLYSDAEKESWPRPKVKNPENPERCSTPPCKTPPKIPLFSPSNSSWLRITGVSSPRASHHNKIYV